jgi:putative salt-induced outer membrane protein YdiY
VLLDYVWDTIDNRETRIQGTAERLSGKEHYLFYVNVDYLYNNHLLQQDRREGTFTWEHQLTKTFYSIAEPDYLHEIRQTAVDQYQMRVGVGASLFQTDRSQVRVAVLSYFSRLDIPAVDRRVENVYPALRLDSKWQILHGLKFEQEGTAYYIPNGGESGVDNKTSLTKDIFGGLTLTLQHEYHHEEIPNASATRNELKLLLGYTF